MEINFLKCDSCKCVSHDEDLKTCQLCFFTCCAHCDIDYHPYFEDGKSEIFFEECDNRDYEDYENAMYDSLCDTCYKSYEKGKQTTKIISK